MRQRQFLAYGILMFGLVSVAVAADKPDPTGTWKWSITANDQTRELTLKLKLDGEKLTGSMLGRNNQETAIEMLRSLITVSLLVVTPIIGAAIIVGVIVSLLQAVTSIQEPTLSFAPKLIAVGAVIVVGAPWIIRQLMQFTIFFINKIPEMTK